MNKVGNHQGNNSRKRGDEHGTSMVGEHRKRHRCKDAVEMEDRIEESRKVKINFTKFKFHREK